jgi:hypothetical protein
MAMDLRVEKTLQLYEAEIRSLYASLGFSDEQRDEIEFDVKRAFICGVNSAYCEAALRFLNGRYKSQQDIADELGKRDRTSISKMESSKRIDGNTLSWMLTRFADFRIPSKSHALVVGYAAAISILRELCGQWDGHPDEALSGEQFECLLRLFSNADWLQASVARNRERKTEVEERVLRQLKRGWNRPFPVRNVHGLRQIVQEWARYFLICIDMIPTLEGE